MRQKHIEATEDLKGDLKRRKEALVVETLDTEGLQPNILVDLPPEVHQEGACGTSKSALYGTRVAAHARE